MTEPGRSSTSIDRQDQSRWRSVIRWFAIVCAIMGLALIGHEVWETLRNDNAKIHLGTMLWGIALLSFGLLILQRGDVTASLKEITASGTIVRSWWRPGRADDAPGTTVSSVIVEPKSDAKNRP